MPVNFKLVSRQTLISSAPASNLDFALQHVIEPFRKRQRDAIVEHARTNVEEATAALGTAQRHRYDRMRLVPYYHDDSAYLEYTFVTNELLRRLRPVIILDSFNGPCIRKALEQNNDGGLFFLPPNLVAAPAQIDPDLLHRAINRSSYSDLFNKAAPPSALAPALSGLMLCAPAEFAAIQTDQKWNRSGIRCGVVLAKGRETPGRISDTIFDPLSSQSNWDKQIQGLFQMRSWPELPCPVSSEALRVMAKFHNELAAEVDGLSPEDASLVMSSVQLSWRFAFCLWLTEENRGALSQQTAATAVGLAKFYRPSVPVICRDDLQHEVIDEIIITRIRRRGPIRRRELYRTFNRQQKAIHEPVIDRLLATGRLEEDKDGRLLLPIPGSHIDVTPKILRDEAQVTRSSGELSP
ncbi:MAG: hypothetical protein H0X66_21200 [Verrucomicrobia bacterium]|nr:hypothetical protein [Verrucomicrobiota bacterium]